MKQLNLVLFLITLSSFSCKLLLRSRFTSKIRSEQLPNHASFSIRGNLQVQDVGAAVSDAWVCANNGTILKSSASPVQLILTNNIKGDCLSVDVDYTGFPWVVTKTGSVFQLKQVHGNSTYWDEVYKADKGKAIDIGCNQFKSFACYIVIENENEPYVFNQGVFMKSPEFTANSKIKRIDVGYGVNKEKVFVVNEDNFVLELKRNKPPVSLGLIANDLSVGYDNNLYAINGNGVYLMTKCSNYFVRIHSLFAQNIAVGKELWLVGKDTFVYKGSTNSYVDTC
jgi:hypothetical protein